MQKAKRYLLIAGIVVAVLLIVGIIFAAIAHHRGRYHIGCSGFADLHDRYAHSYDLNGPR